MKRLLLCATLFLNACGGHAGPFRLMPVDLPPKPQDQDLLLYVEPFQDKRRAVEVFSAQNRMENVVIEAVGLSLAARSWQERPYKHIALLWHRQLGAAFAGTDIPAVAAEEPAKGPDQALQRAGDLGARYVLSGRIEKLEIKKRGADDIFGTAFSGMNYNMLLNAQVRLVEVASGQVVLDKPWTYKRRFFDPTRMGSPDHKTFPGFFSAGSKDAAEMLAGWSELRSALGKAPYTPTPTPTTTPLAVPPTPGPSPTPGPTAEPTPDLNPYWENPNTGKRVDPSWNFDPEDGTPRKKFILRQPTAPRPTAVTTPKPKPGRATQR